MTDFTDTQLLIDEKLVHQLITTQFPEWKNLAIQPVAQSGWDNRTFHLGEEMSIRLPSAACYEQQVEKEQRWLPKLAPHLPLPISLPLAMGKSGEGYPWNWSIYKWLDGVTASSNTVANLQEFAVDLAGFLIALQKIDVSGGPIAGEHNFYRGGLLSTYDAQTRQAIKILGNKIDTNRVIAIWDQAISTLWKNTPVWVHGDIAPGNLLVNQGKLCAVIDFGCLSIGDPACDLAIAWTFFKDHSRNVFRKVMALDEDTWLRGRGWVLWKALIVCAGLCGANPLEIEKSWGIIDEVMMDYNKYGYI